MSKQEKKGLVPALRFPEFRDKGEWEEKLLGSVGEIVTGKTPSTSDESLWNGEIQFVTPTDISEEKYQLKTQRSVSGHAAAKVLPKYSTMFTCIASIGKMALSVKPCITNQQINSIVPNKDYENEFIYYSLLCIAPLIKSKQSNSTLPIINKTDFSKFTIPVPQQFEEQQKIADCLTSVDELITAQTQKLDALKTHKKGLMQQLFPAEGEIVPKRRFPEFRDKGEWEEKRLGDVGSVRMCKRIFKEQTSPRGDIPFYKIGTFGGVPDAYISRELFENYRNNFPFPRNGAVLISAAGTIGRTVVYKGELEYFQDSNIVWLDNNENLIADNFLFYLYQLINWAPSVGAIQRLYNENILGAQVKFPSIPEQQKIADCLTSIDELITAQTQKVESLKAHKRGLLQQLFPAMNEVSA